MKKIAPAIAFFSLPQFSKKVTSRKQHCVITGLLLLVFLFPCSHSYSQQTLGTFPMMEGGFETGTPVTLGDLSASPTVITGTQLASWSYAKTSQNTVSINSSIVRSGTKSLDWSTSSSSAIMLTPTAPTTAIAGSTSYVVQFYYWKNNTGSARNYDIRITADATANLGGTVASGILGNNSAASTSWLKATAIVSTAAGTATPRYGFAYLKGNGGSFNNFLIDDYCIYPGSAVDVTAPGDATAPSATYVSGTQLNVSWTAPAGGVDGGGYVVVRYNSDPSTEPAPNANGIYSTGNIIGTGTIAYIGIGTSFSNTGLTAATLYYYRVYTVDKAFNFSPTPITFVGLTAPPATPVISLTMPGVIAASIERNSVTDIIYSFSMTATTYYSTLTQLSFPNTSGTYSSSDFANFKLYSSTINVFPGGTPLATINAPTNVNPQTFTGFTKIIPPSPATIYFWITTDVKALATVGNSITVTPDLAAGNLTFSGTPPAVSIASATASGTQTIVAPAQYTWSGGSTGSWIVSTNWTPTRTTPKASDDIIFNSAGTVAVNNVPTQTVSSLLVSNAGNVTLTSAAASTLTILNISGLGFADLNVNSGSALTLGSAVNLTLGTATTADISGVLNIISGGTYNTNAANAVTTVTNSTYPLAIDGIINNSGTFTCTNAARLVVKNGAVYNHALNGGLLPTATWNTNSACLISAMTSGSSISGHNQAFSKLIWDCPAQSNFYVLGAGTSNASPYSITDSFIVRRTNGQILQLTSTGGQKDVTCGNFFQYGGKVAVTYQTNDAGGQRSLTVNNTFYVTDSIVADAKFYIINNPSGENTDGRLFVKGNVEMHKTISTTTLEKVGTSSNAELWFTGSAAQYAKFSTISGNIDFVTNHTGPGVTLASDAMANKFKLTQGQFYIASNTLTITNAVSYPAPGTATIGGSSTSNLIMSFVGAAGTLNFFSGSRILKDFTQTAGNTTTLGTELSITAGASPGRDSLGIAAILNTNDNLVLRSDINGTARMARIPVDGAGAAQATIIGKVTVERYLPMNISSDARRWRLLTAPFKTTNSPTINAAWQEGASNPDRLNPSLFDPKPGYGTHITRNAIFGSDGYDQGITSNPSIYYYAAGNWLAPANTNAVKITDNGGCYMLFARGDRSIIVSTTTINASPTTLDPKGELNTGKVTVPMVASGFQAVGNPYASSILLDNVLFNDTLGNKKTIYLWDPKTLGSFNVGKFITCSGDGGSPASYTYTGNTSAYNSRPGVIESSGAFIVSGNSGNITFNETDKIFNSSSVGIASRPVQPINSLGKICKLYTDLFVIKNGEAVLADGVANCYNKNYENSIDNFDASKFTSFTSKEELSIKRNSALFAVERRNNVFREDTIFLNISKLSLADYQFSFMPSEFNSSYSAYLEDNYLHTATAIDLAVQSIVSFSITADPASAVSNRFQIVFLKNTAPKSIQLTAVLNQNDAMLDWLSSDEEDTELHEIERSADGIHFSRIATQNPGLTAAGKVTYSWIDPALAPGNYYYRIPFKNEAGNTAYSNIAKVSIHSKTGAPAVFPNPVTNGIVNLYMGNLPAGNYTIRIISTPGQVMYSGNIQHNNINSTKTIELSSKNEKGIYHLDIISAGKKIQTLKLLIQ